MALLRDVVRDTVGILFPGAFLILLVLWLFWGVTILFGSSELLINFFAGETFYAVSMVIIFSYIAGQILRMKQLHYVEEVCTKHYRNNKVKELRRSGELDLIRAKHEKPITNLITKQTYYAKQTKLTDMELVQATYEDSAKNLDEMYKQYFENKLDITELKKAYRKHNNTYGLWESFPYSHLRRGRRIIRKFHDFNNFFSEYELLGLTKYPAMFNFFKSVIFEYSPSFKEEVLRQESLVRLFSGIYYAIRIGVLVNIIVGSLHAVRFLAHYLRLGFLSCENVSIEYSYGIFMIAGFALVVFWYMNNEILDRLRFMRSRELRLAFEGYYLICKERGFDFLSSKQVAGTTTFPPLSAR